jgi:hypothetical protein
MCLAPVNLKRRILYLFWNEYPFYVGLIYFSVSSYRFKTFSYVFSKHRTYCFWKELEKALWVGPLFVYICYVVRPLSRAVIQVEIC